MLPLCVAEGVGVIPWSPLARGLLARPWSEQPATHREQTDAFARTLYARTRDADRAVVEAVGAASERLGVPRAQVALAWLRTKPGVVSPIVGVSKLAQLEDAAAALSVKLDAETIAALEAPYIPHAVVGFA